MCIPPKMQARQKNVPAKAYAAGMQLDIWHFSIYGDESV
jgi:hypothetical protein